MVTCCPVLSPQQTLEVRDAVVLTLMPVPLITPVVPLVTPDVAVVPVLVDDAVVASRREARRIGGGAGRDDDVVGIE